MPERPRLIEIVGLAGAGKTTLSRELCRGGAPFLQGRDFETATWAQRFRYAGYSLVNALRSFSVLSRLVAERAQVSREDVKKILYLSGWSRVLSRQTRAPGAIMIVDQGPLFCLATLWAFGPRELRTDAHRAWWDRMYTSWAEEIDAIVRLDAPQEVLLDRVNERLSFHVIQRAPTAEALEFLASYRSAYDHTFTEVRAKRPIVMLEYDTSRKPTAAIAEELRDRWTCGDL